MTEKARNSFEERLKTAAEAKKALVDKFKPKPAVTDPNIAERAAEKARALEQVRQARAEAKVAKQKAAEQALEAARQNVEAAAAAELDAKRGERKERKALTKADAKAKRDERYAARKARR